MFDLSESYIKLIEPDSLKFTDCLYEVNHTHSNVEFIRLSAACDLRPERAC